MASINMEQRVQAWCSFICNSEMKTFPFWDEHTHTKKFKCSGFNTVLCLTANIDVLNCFHKTSTHTNPLNFLCDLWLKIFITSTERCKPVEYRVKNEAMSKVPALTFHNTWITTAWRIRETICLGHNIVDQHVSSVYGLYLQNRERNH